MTMPESRQLAYPGVTENPYLGFLFLWNAFHNLPVAIATPVSRTWLIQAATPDGPRRGHVSHNSKPRGIRDEV
jgi:hypothetical protein